LNSLVHAVVQAGFPVALEAGDFPVAERLVALLRELAVTHGLETWSVWARCFEAVLLIKRGESAVGSQRLRAALAELPEAAFNLHRTPLLADLAEGFGSAGQVADGLSVVAEALARVERREERWILPELLRKKGELLLLAGAPASEAQEHFERALDLARGRGVAAWELRSATSLARLWHRQGRGGPARELLSPIYRQFTEGFDTIDLRAAEALLADLD
jgi:predicted ATPase